MKKLMLSLIVMLLMSFGASANVLTSAFPPAAAAMVLYQMAVNEEITESCYNEPLRTVAHASNPNGYIFDVAGCDYQAKKDRLILKPQ